MQPIEFTSADEFADDFFGWEDPPTLDALEDGAEQVDWVVYLPIWIFFDER
jgi:hypothetical protein